MCGRYGGQTSNQTVTEGREEYSVLEQARPQWKRFGQMEVPDVRRRRELEKEKSRLKRIVAERDLRMVTVGRKNWQSSRP